MQNYSTIHTKKFESQEYVNAVKHELTGYKHKTFTCWNANRIFFFLLQSLFSKNLFQPFKLQSFEFNFQFQGFSLT